MSNLTLYFSPLACSAASRAVLYDVEAKADFVEVGRDKQAANGRAFLEINPMGLVPALALEDGKVVTENAAVLQYLGDRYSERGLMPKDAWQRTQVQSWLSFVGSELHKTVFAPIFDTTSPAEVKEYALKKANQRLDFLARELEGKTTLVASGVTVADAYLATILNWTRATPIDLRRWPTLVAYLARMMERPSFARAFGEERTLWATRNPERAKALGMTA